MADWHAGDVRFLTLAQLGQRYAIDYPIPTPRLPWQDHSSVMDNSLP